MSGTSSGTLSSTSGRSFGQSAAHPGSGVSATAPLLASSGPGVGVRQGSRESPRTSLMLHIDKVATEKKLAPHYRIELQGCIDDVYELSPEFWGSTIREMATLYQVQQTVEKLQESQESLKTEVSGMKVQLTKRFVISDEQMEDILLLCKSLVVEGGRDDYDFHDEALDHLKDVARYPRFKDVFKSKANTKNVLTAIRRQASYVRNSYRAYLRDSIFDIKKKCGFTLCVRGVVRKYLDGDRADLQVVFQVLLLRKYIRDNPALVARNEPELGEDGSVDDDDEDGTRPRSAKRARLQPHFWAEWSAWIKQKYQDWGEDFRNAGWARYIDECIVEERRLFPDDKLLDIPQRASGVSRGEDDDDFAASPDVAPARRTPSPRSPPRLHSPRLPLRPHSPRSPLHRSRSPRSPSYAPRFVHPSASAAPVGPRFAPQFSPIPGPSASTLLSRESHTIFPPPPPTNFTATERSYAQRDQTGYPGYPSMSGSQTRLPSMSATFGGAFN